MNIHSCTLVTAAAPAISPGRHLRARSSRDLGMRAALRSERGDVPGWVMITLMTAAIVVALWAVASDQIVAVFENAMAPFLKGV